MRGPTTARRRVALLCALACLAAAACTEGGSDGPGARGDDPSATPLPRPSASFPKVVAVTEPVGDWFQSTCELPLELLQRERRGINPGHSPELSVVPREPNYFGGFTAFTHSGPWDYTQLVPLVFYGPGFIRSRGNLDLGHEASLADLAPTLAELLGTRLPGDRPGRAISDALVPASQRPDPPKLILTVVWDGGGYNVLNTWPDAWPYLGKLMEEGTSVADVISGSAPSVTPAIHANIGTGAFPKQHGIVDTNIRDGDGTRGAFAGRAPQYLLLPTLADLYDQATNNRAKIGMFAYKSWHLGMMGHGAFIDGGDKDIAILADRGSRLVTNDDYYALPPYLADVGGFGRMTKQVDIADGRADGDWMGHDVLGSAAEARHSPVWAIYQTKLMEQVLGRERFGADDVTDMFFINYKQVDDVGHDYNMLEPEVEQILRYSDRELRRTVAWLNHNIGRDQWVLAVTADHGQGPEPKRSGAWPIRMTPLMTDVADHFGVDAEDLFDDQRPGSFWINEDYAAATGITLEELADFFINYRLKENLLPGEEIPAAYAGREDELIFAGAFPTDEIGRLWHCATKT